MIRMLFNCSTPSIFDKSWLTTVSPTPVLPLFKFNLRKALKLIAITRYLIRKKTLLTAVPLCLHIASISSNIIICKPLFGPSLD